MQGPGGRGFPLLLMHISGGKRKTKKGKIKERRVGEKKENGTSLKSYRGETLCGEKPTTWVKEGAKPFKSSVQPRRKRP